MKNLSVFVEKFLVGDNIIMRTVVVKRKPETLPVFLSFRFYSVQLCFVEIRKFAEVLQWEARREETENHRRNSSHTFLLESLESRELLFEQSTFLNRNLWVKEKSSATKYQGNIRLSKYCLGHKE